MDWKELASQANIGNFEQQDNDDNQMLVDIVELPEQEEKYQDQRFISYTQKTKFSLDKGYDTTEITHPWPEGFEVQQTYRVLVDANRWPVNLTVPQIDFKRGLFPFPWNNSQIQEKCNEKDFTNDILKDIAFLPSIPLVIWTPSLFLLLNCVGLNQPTHDTHKHSPVMLSSSVLMCYSQVAHFLEHSPYHDLTVKEDICSKHEKEVLDLKQKIKSLVMQTNSFTQLSKYLEEDLNRELSAEQQDVLMEFARYIVSYTFNHIRLMEKKIMYLSPFKELDPNGKKARPYFVYPALPDIGRNELAQYADLLWENFKTYHESFLKLKYEYTETVLSTPIAIDQSSCYRGMSMTGVKHLLVLIAKTKD